MDNHSRRTQASYDRVAEEYARRIFAELKDKPLDRELLDRLANRVQTLGPVCDLGCGPGQVASYLYSRGAQVLGVDLSERMVELACRLNPQIEFRQGDMRALPAADNSWGGAAAFYSLIHIGREEMAATLKEIRRVFKPE